MVNKHVIDSSWSTSTCSPVYKNDYVVLVKMTTQESRSPPYGGGGGVNNVILVRRRFENCMDECIETRTTSVHASMESALEIMRASQLRRGSLEVWILQRRGDEGISEHEHDGEHDGEHEQNPDVEPKET